MTEAGSPSTTGRNPSPRSHTVLCVLYAITALAALIATWSQNIRFFAQEDNGGLAGFLRDAWANPAAASLSNDVLLVALAAAIFMVAEARRLGIRHVWIYLVMSGVVAISVAFPLFLLVRQRRLDAARARHDIGAPAPAAPTAP